MISSVWKDIAMSCQRTCLAYSCSRGSPQGDDDDDHDDVDDDDDDTNNNYDNDTPTTTTVQL